MPTELFPPLADANTLAFLDAVGEVRPLEEVERGRSAVGLSDGVRMMRRPGEPDRLGFVLGRNGESTELGKTHDQPVAIRDRRRYGADPRYPETQFGGSAARFSMASSTTRRCSPR